MTWQRRASFCLLTLLLLYGALEVASFALVWLIGGQPFSFEQAAARRAAAQAGGSGAAAQLEARAGHGPQFWSESQVAHPYVGSVIDVDRAAAGQVAASREINAYGFHGPLPFAQPGEDEAVVERIAIVGGSFAVQFCLAQRLRLEQALMPRFDGRPVRVHCLGQGGMRQPQQLAAVAFFTAVGARFDLVINIDGYNDVTLPVLYNWRRGMYLYFPHGWDVKISRRPDAATLAAAGEATLLAEARAGLARTFDAAPLSWSVTAQLVWGLMDDGLAARWHAAQAALALPEEPPRWQAASDEFAARGPPLAYDDEATAQRAAVAVWADSSRALRALVEGGGGRYLHLLQPNQYVADSKPLSAEELAGGVVDPDSFYAPSAIAGYRLLIAAGRQLPGEGLAFVDLTQLFASVAETVYADNCCHLTPSGYALVGDALLRILGEDAP